MSRAAVATRVRPAIVEAPAEPHGSRIKLIVCVAVVVAAIGWVAARGLTGNLVYYLTPSDVLVHHQAAVGQSVRVGGYVIPHTVRAQHHHLSFTITDGKTSMRVVDTGSVPELFKAGQGVVVEGALGRDGRFHSDSLLVKHNGDYRPPAPLSSAANAGG